MPTASRSWHAIASSCARLADVYDDLNDYLTAPRWYQSQIDEGEQLPKSIGYFSPEFGITEVLPQYSGGLGILAGDHLKAASDLGVPIIGVGLLYGSGYFRQSLSPDGWQLEHYPSLDPGGLPIRALKDADDAPVRVAIALPESRTLYAQVWVARVGRVPLLLLDSDIEENDLAARQVTDRLYGGGREHRLEQELLLGVGGVRAIRAYCEVTGADAPEVFHTNEGHAGFLGIERIRELVQNEGLDFDEALQAVRAGTVFTTHTPVPAGIDRFDRDLVAAHLGGMPGVPIERVLALGAEDDPGIFNMAHMGLRIGQRANGVSVLHGEVSREMFSNLWPGFDASEVPISSITNGVHAPTWMSRDILEIAEREVGAAVLAQGGGWEAIDKVSDRELWNVRNTLRERLVHEVRRRVRASSLERGMIEAELGWTNGVFDPDVLTIGFARRVPSYKRLTLMLRDPQRLRALLLDPERPVQIVIAGKSHPADDGGKQLIAQMVKFADDHGVRHRIAFLPDYDIAMARYLYWGVDVWLNNPLRPLEACGTSGHEGRAQRRAEPVDPRRVVGRVVRRRERLGHPVRRRHRRQRSSRRPRGARAVRADREERRARGSTTVTARARRLAGCRWCGTRSRRSARRCSRRAWCATTCASSTRPRRSRRTRCRPTTTSRRATSRPGGGECSTRGRA